MKAITDCFWKVRINHIQYDHDKWFWVAYSPDDAGLGHSRKGTSLVMKKYLATKKKTENHWERFAKLNQIKNWSYE